MRRNFTRLFVFILLCTAFGVAASPCASGQSAPISVRPTALYRFEVSYWDGGHLLTGFYQEGPANGYSFDPFNYPGFDGLGIYVAPSGYTPDPSSGLVPLHRWTVIQNGWRTHYYYSTYYSQQPSDRYYNGIAGWVFPPGQAAFNRPEFLQPLALHQLSVWYSQDLGFWNGYGEIGYSSYVEPPPDRDGKRPYGYQGVICALPPAMADPQFPHPPPVGGTDAAYDVTFSPPPPPQSSPPPGSCESPSGAVNRCDRLGGTWNFDTCSCEY